MLDKFHRFYQDWNRLQAELSGLSAGGEVRSSQGASRGGRRGHRVRPASSRGIPEGLRYQVLSRDGGRCVLCGRSQADGVKLHVDHILPRSQGGTATLDNLQTLCAPCNRGKSNRDQRDWRR
jgi:5-methylcytosine-specific restriction endonuclease McrA